MIYDYSTLNKLTKLKEKAETLVEVSKLFYRDNTCLENCGCCMKFTLVYWGDRWERFKLLHPEEIVNFRQVNFMDKVVWEDLQSSNKDYFCKHLDKSNGRCKLHFTQKPIHCEMEPISFSDGFLTKRPFKEAHIMETLEGKGATCYMSPVDGKVRPEDIKLLKELNTLFNVDKLNNLIEELEND